MSNVRNSRSKYWCFTLNNYTAEEEKRLQEVPVDAANYVIYGREVSESGTPHLQGYAEFVIRQRLSAVKRLLGTRGHYEVSRGTQLEATTYCRKDGDVFERGTPARRGSGRRTDLEDIRQAILANEPEEKIADEHFSKWVVYRRSFTAYRHLKNPPKDRPDLRVIVLWGTSGVGKSSYVNSRYPNCWISGDPVLKWFDGYNGESVVLIDDFNGECPFRFFLRLLDLYRLRVPVKGGFVAWNPTTLFITSNREIGEWYQKDGRERDVLPIRRRVHLNQHVDRLGPDIASRHGALDELLERI